ncbi:Uncharacterized protein C4.03c [Ceratocystis fimbriata CBS 114723]|uniref:Uncharacterized protein C4.03c n=1 Tax=Ceratocystis fimbriata CBS 114723 TaxID=1035309 RepID=A0A2C5XDC1_9PEZI|nr:Uncharacterized protein C4.03c [Ceratocystis fimbriata CBS 114723]
MADYGMFHALGQGEQLDPNDPSRTSQPVPAPFQPPVAANPYEKLQQAPQQQPQPHLQQHQPHFQPSGPPTSSAPPPHSQYGGHSPAPTLPYGIPPPPSQPNPYDLASQMAGMSLGPGAPPGAAPPPMTGAGSDALGATARRKKKDRHAYHTVEAPVGTSFGAAPSMGGGAPPDNFTGSGIPPIGDSSSQFIPAASATSPFGSSAPAPAPGSATSPVFGGDPLPAPAVVPAVGPSTISADDTPGVPTSRDSLQPFYFQNVYPTFERHVPPPATTSFVAFDQGNASPKHSRLTMNSIPISADKLATTGVPLGLILQPLAAQQPGELDIPVLDFGSSGPPRCHRCRAYINPFMMFRSGGNKFVCNLCTYPNDTPPEYFCATSPAGVRVDRDSRPELTRGTVEFVVPKEYWTKEPVGLRWLFVIDVTQDAVNKGVLETFCEGILAALYSADTDGEAGDGDKPPRSVPEGVKVGFMTFDRDIHFYNCSSSLEQAQMLIMPDLNDPFVPLGSGLFVDPYESRSVITQLLTRLPEMFSSIKNPEPAMLAALNAAVSALEPTGGKMITSLSCLPTWGPGNLFMRDDGKTVGGEPDKRLLTTEHPLWKKVVERMVPAGIGADFFLVSPNGGYLDIGTVGHVSALTGGETFYYPNFVAPRDGKKMALEIKHAVTRETGYQALMKVRCSNGLQVSSYHGNFIHHTFGADLEIGVLDADKAFGVSFTYDGKLDPKLDAHFQMALLYTTASGQRRVRCCNIIASVNDNPRDAMKFIDQDAVYTLLAKEAATKLATTGATLKDARNFMTERTIDVMACYRKNFLAPSHPPSQLVMPDRLKEFPMYMLGLNKTRAFKAGTETSDRRVNELRLIRSIGAREMSLYLYPRILALHNLQPEEGFPDAETGHLKIPPAMRASFSRVEAGGVYLVDNGQVCILWLHAQTSPNLISDLLGDQYTSLKEIGPYMAELPVLQTHLNAQVRNIVEFLRSLRGSKGLTIQIARQGLDGAEYEFARMLVEDRNNEAQSYVDWLVHIHKSVQHELNGSRKREDASESTFAGLRAPYWS